MGAQPSTETGTGIDDPPVHAPPEHANGSALALADQSSRQCNGKTGRQPQLGSIPSSEQLPMMPARGTTDRRQDNFSFAMTTRRSYGDMSEAESERSETSSISLKRTFSQSSMGQSSTRMTPSGAATPATGTLTPADHEADLKAVRVSRSGTWPLRRRKHLHGSVGSNELGSQLDLWEMQDTLQLERVQLANQLAKLTGVGSAKLLSDAPNATGESTMVQSAPAMAEDAIMRENDGFLRNGSDTYQNNQRDECWMDDLKQLVEQVAHSPEEEDDDFMLEKILNVLQRGSSDGPLPPSDVSTRHEQHGTALSHAVELNGCHASHAGSKRVSGLAGTITPRANAAHGGTSQLAFAVASQNSAAGHNSRYRTSGSMPKAPTGLPLSVLNRLLPVPEGKSTNGGVKSLALEPKMSRAASMPETALGDAGCSRGLAEESIRTSPSARPKEYKCKRCGAPKKGHFCKLERDVIRTEGARKEWSLQEDAHILNSVAEHGCRWRLIAASMQGRSDDAVRNRWNRLKDRIGPDGNPLDLGVDGPVDDHDDPASKEADPVDFATLGPLKDSPAAIMDPVATERVSSFHSLTDDGHEPEHVQHMREGHVSSVYQPQDLRMSSPNLDLPILSPAAALTSRQHIGEDRRKTDRVGWSAREDAIIANSVAEFGNRWYFIAERLPGRTDHAIRNRWHRLRSMRHDQQLKRIAQGDEELKQESKLQQRSLSQHRDHVNIDVHSNLIDGRSSGPPLILSSTSDPLNSAYATWR